MMITEGMLEATDAIMATSYRVGFDISHEVENEFGRHPLEHMTRGRHVHCFKHNGVSILNHVVFAFPTPDVRNPVNMTLKAKFGK